jgi:hypothetical protein
MVMIGMGRAAGRSVALVPVTIVLTVRVAIVEVVDVIVVLHCSVATVGPVLMIVLGVDSVFGGGAHGESFGRR